MPILDPCKSVHVEIQQSVYQDQLFIEGSSNRPYLCRNCVLLLCQMIMTLFSPNFHASWFFSRGSNSYCFLCAAASIVTTLTFWSGERYSRCFCVQQHHSLKFELCHQEREAFVVLCVQQHHSLKLNFCPQEKRSFVVLCVQQHHSLKLEFCPQEKRSFVVLCVQQHHFFKLNFWPQEKRTCVVSCVHQHFCITFEPCSPVRETAVVFGVQQNHWTKPVLSYRERGTLDIVSLLQNLFSNFVRRNIQHAF